ncbi:helix-turn-helix domain-containing protein [Allokutzneria sp. A3M-2-11 16]|uniref:helix-turn-helix domain-containing protein n=1 Tax=Allokutzneria sp. A3M-2-11 16 TaxID=2962043 RepID=UPI0020B76D8B|nr:helix-turn-helix domain-containing protein [Allokutzneria sp. A3M-2-11 16]MCP3797725.1 helix-turn-helix domain-containing protein [Allokutzneria sp. A3M-2-11 16]
MSTALERHTVLPPKQHLEHLNELAQVLHLPQRATLVDPDGTHISLPPEVYDVLRTVVDALSQGMAITIAPHTTLLTTQEAADLLGISRPTLVRLLEDGEIEFHMRGRHRRVLLSDVVAYQERARERRRAVLDEMTRSAAEDGTYDNGDGFIRTR